MADLITNIGSDEWQREILGRRVVKEYVFGSLG